MRSRAGFIVAALLLASPALAEDAKPGLRPSQAPEAPKASPDKPAAIPGFEEPSDPFAAYQRGFYATAFQLALKRVEANKTDAAAMTLLGQLYREGNGAPRDPAEAARWFRLAADLGDANAAFAYGVSLLKGQGVPLDRAAAQKQFQRAADKGHSEALYDLGVMAIEDQRGVMFGDDGLSWGYNMTSGSFTALTADCADNGSAVTANVTPAMPSALSVRDTPRRFMQHLSGVPRVTSMDRTVRSGAAFGPWTATAMRF